MRIPKPQIVTAPTSYGVAYAWSCESKKLGLRVLGDTQAEAKQNYQEAVEREYPNMTGE